jgi:hypothetical protein
MEAEKIARIFHDPMKRYINKSSSPAVCLEDKDIQRRAHILYFPGYN